MTKIMIRVEKYPTESEEKIIKAVENIFDINRDELKEIKEKEKTIYLYETDNLNVLNKFKARIKHRNIQIHVRAYMQRNILANRTHIYLNKQTATIGKVSICESPYECPLGAILLEIEEENLTALNDIIEWLTT